MFIPPVAWAFILAACCLFFILFAVRVYITLSRPYKSVDAEARAAEEGRPVNTSDQCVSPALHCMCQCFRCCTKVLVYFTFVLVFSASRCGRVGV